MGKSSSSPPPRSEQAGMLWAGSLRPLLWARSIISSRTVPHPQSFPNTPCHSPSEQVLSKFPFSRLPLPHQGHPAQPSRSSSNAVGLPGKRALPCPALAGAGSTSPRARVPFPTHRCISIQPAQGLTCNPCSRIVQGTHMNAHSCTYHLLINPQALLQPQN